MSMTENTPTVTYRIETDNNHAIIKLVSNPDGGGPRDALLSLPHGGQYVDAEDLDELAEHFKTIAKALRQ